MTKRNLLMIVIGLIISLLVAPALVILVATYLSPDQSEKLTNNPPQRSDIEISQAIARSDKNLRDIQGNPTFKLLKQKRIASNWYIAWIDDSTIKVLLNDPEQSAEKIRVIAGPASTFSESTTLMKGVPKSVFEDFINEKI